MVPNLAPSQQDLIRAIILDKKLKTYKNKLANFALNLHYFSTTKLLQVGAGGLGYVAG